MHLDGYGGLRAACPQGYNALNDWRQRLILHFDISSQGFHSQAEKALSLSHSDWGQQTGSLASGTKRERVAHIVPRFVEVGRTLEDVVEAPHAADQPQGRASCDRERA